MNKYQLFALDHFLTDYPEDKGFDVILELIEEGDESITVCETYEGFWDEHIAEMVIDMARALEAVFYETH